MAESLDSSLSSFAQTQSRGGLADTGRVGQENESRVMREAAERLAEQRQREREAARQQREMMRWMEEEGLRRQQAETIRRQEERRRVQEEGVQRQELGRERHPRSFDQRVWLERYRQSREQATLARQELADHTSQRRQRARGARQEVDSSTTKYGIVTIFLYFRSVRSDTDGR